MQKLGNEMMESDAVTKGLPSTTKGDLIVNDGASNVRLPVGSDGQVLTADSSAGNGVAWKDNATPPAYVGEIRMFAFAALPDRWLECDGSAVSRTTYSDLFNKIGETYGAGDGSSTFNLPDLRGRVPLGMREDQGELEVDTIDLASDEIVFGSAQYELYTGAQVTFRTTGTAPGGLSDGATYYVIRTSDFRIRLCATVADAKKKTNWIDITSGGSGTHTLEYKGRYRSLGQKCGEAEHQLNVDELAPHSHSYDKCSSAAGSACSQDANGSFTSATTGEAGGSEAQNNLPPAQVVVFAIYAGE